MTQAISIPQTENTLSIETKMAWTFLGLGLFSFLIGLSLLLSAGDTKSFNNFTLVAASLVISHGIYRFFINEAKGDRGMMAMLSTASTLCLAVFVWFILAFQVFL